MNKTYGGLPVSDDYLARYGLWSDQEVYGGIAIIVGTFAFLLGAAAIALLVWS